MSAYLYPAVAAGLANLVYAIENNKTYTKRQLQLYRKDWNFDTSFNAIQASSGTALILRKTTGFCSIAIGQQNSVYKNHVLVLTRGTSNPYDWASDATTGLCRSSSGHLVHMGFQAVFREMQMNGLNAFSNGQKNIPVKVHCVGHSLGGALATLIAVWIKNQNKAAEVALYTFGSPRVGLQEYTYLQKK